MYSTRQETRFPSSPLIIRVPVFLLFGFNKEKGKRVLLGNLGEAERGIHAGARLGGLGVHPVSAFALDPARSRFRVYRVLVIQGLGI